MLELSAGEGTFTGSDPRPYRAIPAEDTSRHHIVYAYD